ncbi:MAG: aspartate--tRNA ligase [Acidobacteria bacterium]|nr:MAG: aspartate--tRNA ligase [Acidobacteriota bacterium]
MSEDRLPRRSCGTLSASDAGDTHRVCGWVAHRRDHGGLVFIDLRDETGVIQVVADPVAAQVFEVAERVRHEWVLEITGTLDIRPEGTENQDLPTGEVELKASSLKVLAESETPPFVIDDRVEVDEALRLRYRYLDLRRPKMLAALRKRASAISAIRLAAEECGLLEVETPTLTRATPEGARDYMVPSRQHPGSAFALAQSPQLYKQLLMVAGIGGYYQITKCWRDEDLRADRQPEFTQLDIELPFAGVDDVLGVVEATVCSASQAIRGNAPDRPFPKMTWAEAMSRFGTDKPDLRIEGELKDLTSVFGGTEFRAFSAAISQGSRIVGLKSKGCPEGASRSWFDALIARATELGAKGLVWILVEPGGELRSPVAKFLSAAELEAIRDVLALQEGDIAMIVADAISVAREVLGRLRVELASDSTEAEREGAGEFAPFWVVDFPFAEWNENEGRLDPLHHPFCAPHPDDFEIISRGSDAIVEAGPESVRALAYDLVADGWELGSGSVRIHTRELQETVFEAIGIDPTEAEEKFGFLLEAFRYGAPPHAGFAIGIDRLIAVLQEEASIREVVAFPKTQTGSEPMTGAPAAIDGSQLASLGLSLKQSPRP